MSDGSNGANIDVIVGTTECEVTGMRGRTVGYLRREFAAQGFPSDAALPAQVFTMGPTETDPAAILKREDGMQMGKNDRGLQILQGWIITVGEGYVLSADDVSVKLFT